MPGIAIKKTETVETTGVILPAEGPPDGPPPPAPPELSATEYDWEGSTPQGRLAFLRQIELFYRAILDEFFDEANSCVQTVKKASRTHVVWRRSLIIATGGLAIVNLLAAYTSTLDSSSSPFAGELFVAVVYQAAVGLLRESLPLFAAVYAAVLAILTNLESFTNAPAKAQAYRDSRELFLDAYREFELRWLVKVTPFYPEPKACVNAAEAYRDLVARDRELRTKLKDLTTTKKASDSPAQGART